MTAGRRRASRDDTAPAAPTAPSPTARVRLRIRRQDGPERAETRRWEEFEIETGARQSLAGALAAIAERPVTVTGAVVAPVAWDDDCVPVGCGGCTLLVDGQPRAACATLVSSVARPGRAIVLEPLAKFPLVRDLVVDRSRAGELLRQLGTWIELEPRAPDAELPVDPELEQRRVELGRCSSCGACLEACPQYGPHTDYVGAAAVARVAFLAGHPVGALTRRRRITALMTPGGIADCGKAEACVEVCPQQIPLVDALQTVGREASRELLLGWLLG